jgi:hypothetical protein
MSAKAPHLKILVDGIIRVDSGVESMTMETTINGDISLIAKQPAIEPDEMPDLSWIEFSRGLRGQNPDVITQTVGDR